MMFQIVSVLKMIVKIITVRVSVSQLRSPCLLASQPERFGEVHSGRARTHPQPGAGVVR